MKKNLVLTLAMIALALVPFAYLAYLWPAIPQTIPMHYNLNLEPDRMGSKNELWTLAGILAGVSILCYLLLTNLKRFDPKQKKGDPSNSFNKMGIVLVVFMAALTIVIISSCVKGSIVFNNFLFPVLGIFFAFLGNYMNNIKPNYIAGFRLPWTLSDDDNWRKTHHLAGKLWFVGGLVIAFLGFIVHTKLMLPLFIGIVAIISIMPPVYSYNLFKSKTSM